MKDSLTLRNFRGPNGRYVRPSGGSDTQVVANQIHSDSDMSAWTATPQPTVSALQESDRSTELSPLAVSDPIQDRGDPGNRPQPTSARRARGLPRAKEARCKRAGSPSFLGESWYASYVMRGSAPDQTDFHRSIDECNETLRKVSRDTHSRGMEPISRESDSQSLPPRNLVDRLINAYFDRFHAFCPIMEKAWFYSSVEDGTLSGTLLRSVLFVASIHCDLQILHLMGHTTRWEASNDLFIKANASFDADGESDRTSMVLSSYLLHYWFGSPNNYRDSHWWLAAAIRSAQCMGYHRSTKNSKMPAKEKSRWSRIWWCLYVSE